MATLAGLSSTPGLLRSEHYVPIQGFSMTGQGQVVIPYEKAHVKAAHKAHRDHILTPNLERDLEIHYFLAPGAAEGGH